MNILVIPEGFRNDQYILKPLFERLFANIGRERAQVRICRDPLPGGVGEALKSDCIGDIVGRYDGMTDIFVLCVDRDGNLGRRQRLEQIEGTFRHGRMFLAENAWEEIETWVPAGLDRPQEWRWADVRAEVHVKEWYFEPLADKRGVADGPGCEPCSKARHSLRTRFHRYRRGRTDRRPRRPAVRGLAPHETPMPGRTSQNARTGNAMSCRP